MLNMLKTLIILDWDDTLFPTTWVVDNSIDLTSLDVRNRYIVFFSKLDLILHKLLSTLISLGTVVIVTNAMVKWIKISSTILPNTQKLISSKIEVISAKDAYQKIYPNDGYMWKHNVFQTLDNDTDYQNIVSVGDADYEFKALISLYDNDENRLKHLKNVKFIKSPSYDILIDQLEVFYKTAKNIVDINKHLDLQFSPTL